MTMEHGLAWCLARMAQPNLCGQRSCASLAMRMELLEDNS